jgi:hypothetical protein
MKLLFQSQRSRCNRRDFDPKQSTKQSTKQIKLLDMDLIELEASIRFDLDFINL